MQLNEPFLPNEALQVQSKKKIELVWCFCLRLKARFLLPECRFKAVTTPCRRVFGLLTSLMHILSMLIAGVNSLRTIVDEM